MNTQHHQQDDVIFNITGYFDAQSVTTLESDFLSLVEESNDRIVLDLKLVDFMDSSGIGSIVFLYKKLKAQNRELVLSGVNGQPARLIQSLRVDKAIATHYLENEANHATA